MIKVAVTARDKVISLMKEEGFSAESDYVRVGVKSGGCSGLSYELTFDREIRDTDKIKKRVRDQRIRVRLLH